MYDADALLNGLAAAKNTARAARTVVAQRSQFTVTLGLSV